MYSFAAISLLHTHHHVYNTNPGHKKNQRNKIECWTLDICYPLLHLHTLSFPTAHYHLSPCWSSWYFNPILTVFDTSHNHILRKAGCSISAFNVRISALCKVIFYSLCFESGVQRRKEGRENPECLNPQGLKWHNEKMRQKRRKIKNIY